ncbi:OmpP1/FadL family transporter [Pelagicoccus mobilis]|uniref:Outer membrane protein transport protein n=1 Tax=Pelagicoccus mobilis TaxID=415221 RepID=A0A934RZQ2_9BACT|nr:outer membrane protein transport protein [Pelagicoccus mobilis]MBK1876804.1 outer membrane protein transport protein [Pelagicoccus mobilis]
MKMPQTVLTFAIGTVGIATSLFGTNGMNMEGYGARATALGGAGAAIDTGTAAPMNNPATLLLQKKEARLDAALGFLGPDVSASMPGYGSVESGSDAFFMPTVGYAKRRGNHAWGLSIYGQGGMGTEYSGDSFMGLGRGLGNMTEVSVGRMMLPYAYQVNEKLGVGGSVDYVWAGMDLCMAMSGQQLMDMANPMSQMSGKASGTLLNAMNSMQMQPEFAYFDFKNGNKFFGEAKGDGFAANLGVTYDLSHELRFGAVYHSATSLGDLTTDAAKVSVGGTNPMGYMEMGLDGDVSINDFQWPATYAVGVMYRPATRWRIVGDIKQIEWSEVMDSFRMSFVANDLPSNGPMAGMDIAAELYQNWSDQTVYSVGVEYATAERGAYRVGFNHATNPIPDHFLNPLFPATVEDHVTIGGEHQVGRKSSISWSGTIGLTQKETNPAFGIVSEHGQTNFQIMYSRFWGE